MSEYIKVLLSLLWGTLFLVWLLYALFSKKGTSSEPWHQRLLFNWMPLLLAFYLLGPGDWFGHTLIREKFVEHTNLVGIIGLIPCLLGFAIAIWSRLLLGTNWSLSVQKKEKHELIIRGPYKLVRHPIYTGLLLMFCGNALIVGDYRAIIAVLIVFVSFWFKLKKEEKLLTEVFGDNYREYMQKTKRMIPWLI
ncbi:MAG: isoprenylcysteine carboxylmethyltransferase family protein [Cyclobacteriaceae bacterium]|nr:isoprenylcysteine carboxylmethyltransferase family protein [Cyclobacteriaceae bacterium]